MRQIDADVMREYWLYNGQNEKIYDANDFLDSIDEQPTVCNLENIIEQICGLITYCLESDDTITMSQNIRVGDVLDILEKGGVNK